MRSHPHRGLAPLLRYKRTSRARALVEALLLTILDLQGAMRAAQLPHLTAIQGIVTTSTGVVPAPLISPLSRGQKDNGDKIHIKEDDAYRKQTQRIVTLLGGLGGSALQAFSFDDVVGYTEVLSSIARTLVPASLTPAPEA